MSNPGSSVAALKLAIIDGLRVAFGDTAAVAYATPIDSADLRAPNGELVAVFWTLDHPVDLTVEIFAGGHYNFDERYQLTLIVQVLEDVNHPEITSLTHDQRQHATDARLDEALGTVLEWLAVQTNPPSTVGPNARVQVFWTVAAGGQRTAFFDAETTAFGSRQELAIAVHARKVPSP